MQKSGFQSYQNECFECNQYWNQCKSIVFFKCASTYNFYSPILFSFLLLRSFRLLHKKNLLYFPFRLHALQIFGICIFYVLRARQRKRHNQ